MNIPPVKTIFKVTVERVTVTHFETTEQQLMAETHYTTKELEDDYPHFRDKENLHQYTRKRYLTVPALGQRSDEKTIYEQTVDTLEITKVIEAVNHK